MKILTYPDPILPEPSSAQMGNEDKLLLYFQNFTDTLRRTFMKIAFTVNFNIAESGTTVNRPADANLRVGQPYFDTTLGKPVWVKTIGPPAIWVDATGAVV